MHDTQGVLLDCMSVLSARDSARTRRVAFVHFALCVVHSTAQ
jgi:hypothetical protein